MVFTVLVLLGERTVNTGFNTTLRKTVVRKNKPQPFGTLGSIAEPGGDTTSRRCVLAKGRRSRARGCMSLPSHQLMARRQGDHTRAWASCHAALRGGVSRRTVEKMNQVAGEAL